ncbi:MAG TPA: hypothetical protein VL947_08120 [Cytophagales bacterium]|nr:hypothetical protein [Cytophagales bacterium]
MMDLNKQVYYAIASLGFPITTSLISMWPSSDIYARVPYLRFRYGGVDKEDQIYMSIKAKINSFHGNLKWDMVTRQEAPNYLITPCDFIKSLNPLVLYEKEEYILKFSETQYRETIDKAIADVPSLANAIRRVVIQ